MANVDQVALITDLMKAQADGRLEEKLTRSEFQRMTSDLLDRTKSPFHAVIKDAGIKIE